MKKKTFNQIPCPLCPDDRVTITYSLARLSEVIEVLRKDLGTHDEPMTVVDLQTRFEVVRRSYLATEYIVEQLYDMKQLTTR